MIIDADSHFFEQPGLWREHMPSSERDLALDVEEDELGYSWLTHRGRRLLQCYISEPGKFWESYGLPHQRGRDGEPALVRYGDMPATYHDPDARRDALTGWGLDQQVLFPNWGLNFGWYLQGDPDSERANIAAWNRWAIEVAAAGGGKLRPVGHLTLRVGGHPPGVPASRDGGRKASFRSVVRSGVVGDGGTRARTDAPHRGLRRARHRGRMAVE
jgi:hypothetical protein